MKDYPHLPDGVIQDWRRWSDNSLFFFAKHVLGYDKLVDRVHEPICLMLQDPRRTRVNITMPRKFFKTSLASIAYPLWKPCARNLNHTMLLVMNTVENAMPKLGELKKHVESNQTFRALYPEVIPDFNKTTWGAKHACLKRPGLHGTPTWNLAGSTSAVTSGAYDELNLDDLLTADEGDADMEESRIPSRRDILRAIQWYVGCVSLLNDPLGGRINNIGTRWAENDLVAYVLSHSREFARNNYELRAVDGLEIAQDEDGFFQIVGGKSTMPEVYPVAALNAVLETTGTTLFRLWYQNEPMDPAELIFNLDSDENYYRPHDMPDGWMDGLRKYTAVDLAYSSGEKSDNTAIVTLGVDEAETRYILDVQYGKFQPMDTVERLFAVYEKFKPRQIGLPKIAAEVLMSKFLPYFMRLKGQALPIRNMPRGGETSKEQRIIVGVQPWVEQRMLKLPRGPLSRPLEIEMRDFRVDRKRSGKRDALDATVDALELSRQQRVEKPVERTRYDRKRMDAIRSRIYSFADDDEADDLALVRAQTRIGTPLKYMDLS